MLTNSLQALQYANYWILVCNTTQFPGPKPTHTALTAPHSFMTTGQMTSTHTVTHYSMPHRQ